VGGRYGEGGEKVSNQNRIKLLPILAKRRRFARKEELDRGVLEQTKKHGGDGAWGVLIDQTGFVFAGGKEFPAGKQKPPDPATTGNRDILNGQPGFSAQASMNGLGLRGKESHKLEILHQGEKNVKECNL